MHSSHLAVRSAGLRARVFGQPALSGGRCGRDGASAAVNGCADAAAGRDSRPKCLLRIQAARAKERRPREGTRNRRVTHQPVPTRIRAGIEPAPTKRQKAAQALKQSAARTMP